ncbi:MAG: sigma-70 family RNA polymerase sigma factor [Candidatus Kapaibacterium sp.]|nr:sigma-70 family RNA polymerase sigma factor [Ignavibacteria bacterium]
MLFRKDHTKREFEAEVLPHLDELYRTAVRLLKGNRDEANDLVQDTFVQAWKSFDRYERGTNARAWLYAILMNKARHYHRRITTRKVVPLSDHGDETLLDRVEGSAPLTAETISDENILAALERLSEEHREVVLLADVQEFSYKEVAEILEIPIGTVMSRLSRARAGLRSHLHTYAGEFGIGMSKPGGGSE